MNDRITLDLVYLLRKSQMMKNGDFVRIHTVAEVAGAGGLLRITVICMDGCKFDFYIDRPSAMLLYAGIRDHSNPFQSAREGEMSNCK
jgi:hypothetical protein